MDWVFLIAGIVLFGMGIVGQFRGRSKVTHIHPDDLRARRWVLTVGSIVAGALLAAVGLAHLLYMLHVARH